MKTTELDFLKNKIFHSLSVLILREFCIKIFSFICQIYVARILLPNDFGVFAIISFIVNFSGLFSDIGLSWAIIQKKEQPDKEELSSIFYFKTILTILTISVLILGANFLTQIYPNFTSLEVQMTRVFSFVLLITAFRSIPQVLLEREIKYYAISVTDVLGVIAYQVTTIFMAINGYGVWSLIFGVLAKETTELLTLFFFKPWLPGWTFSVQKLKKMFRFGAYIQGNAFLNFFHVSIIPVLIGIRNGPYVVGLLDWAQGIALIPNAITDNYGRVAFSGFSRIQHDKKLLSAAIGKSISILSVPTLFFTIVILGFGREVVSILYTEKWLAGMSSLYWFSASTFFIAAMAAIGAGILVTGYSKGIFYANICMKVVEWVLVISLLSTFDFVSIPIAATVSSFIGLCVYLYIGKKQGILPSFWELILPKVKIVLLTFVCIFMLNWLLPASLPWLISRIFISGCVYLFFVYIFSPRDIKDVSYLLSHYHFKK